jgi:hypothetical protein
LNVDKHFTDSAGAAAGGKARWGVDARAVHVSASQPGAAAARTCVLVVLYCYHCIVRLVLAAACFVEVFSKFFTVFQGFCHFFQFFEFFLIELVRW